MGWAPNELVGWLVDGCAARVQDLLETTVVPSGRAEDALQHVQALVDEYQAAVSSAQVWPR